MEKEWEEQMSAGGTADPSPGRRTQSMGAGAGCLSMERGEMMGVVLGNLLGFEFEV